MIRIDTLHHIVRFERYGLLVILLATFTVYGAVAGWLLWAAATRWLGW